MERIKAFIECDPYIRKYKNFSVIEKLPEIGDTYKDNEVTEVNSIRLDPEQDKDEVFNYDFYEIETYVAEEEDYYYYYVAVLFQEER